MQGMQNFESFETFEEVLEHLNRVSSEFQSSIDFALMSKGTYEYTMTLWNSMLAITRIARIGINKHRLQLMQGGPDGNK